MLSAIVGHCVDGKHKMSPVISGRQVTMEFLLDNILCLNLHQRRTYWPFTDSISKMTDNVTYNVLYK